MKKFLQRVVAHPLPRLIESNHYQTECSQEL